MNDETAQAILEIHKDLEIVATGVKTIYMILKRRGLTDVQELQAVCREMQESLKSSDKLKAIQNLEHLHMWASPSFLTAARILACLRTAAFAFIFN